MPLTTEDIETFRPREKRYRKSDEKGLFFGGVPERFKDMEARIQVSGRPTVHRVGDVSLAVIGRSPTSQGKG